MNDFSWIAFIIGAVAFFFLGAAWYTFMFRRPWMTDMGIDPSQPPQSPGPKLLVGSFVVSLVLSGVLERIIGGGANGDAMHGLRVGIGVGAAIAAVMGQNALYDTRPLRLWLINGGYALVGSALVGVIVGAINP
jgi:hypothetical protein